MDSGGSEECVGKGVGGIVETELGRLMLCAVLFQKHLPSSKLVAEASTVVHRASEWPVVTWGTKAVTQLILKGAEGEEWSTVQTGHVLNEEIQ